MKIICVGKKHDHWIIDGISRYERRLRAPFKLDWQFVSYSSFSGDRARRDESTELLKRIAPQDYVILLDETGKNVDSPSLSHKLEQLTIQNQIVFIIGGAYGVDERVKQRANFIWSLSGLVFPHMLVRLILIEQIYRAQEISKGGPYHHQ
jgi:ribosomal RNA large subunit methyltransferase H